MASDNNSSSDGIGFCGMLAILFIGLKLTGHVDWSWWWVLSPLWIPFAIVLAVLLLIAGLSDGKTTFRRNRRGRW